MQTSKFSWTTLGLVFLLTLGVGIGAYALAWQFNDGKMGSKVIGAVFFGMSLPSFLMGGAMRLFRPDLQRYFAISAFGCVTVGVMILAFS